MRSVRLICATLAVLALGRPLEVRGQDATITDSAGVRIVTSPASDATYARLAGEPALSIGVVEGPDALLFDRIVSVARDGDGNLMVVDKGWGEIRVFSAGGEHVRTVGGIGEGPGEFEDLTDAWPRAGGGIMAVDGWRRRITEFGPSGEPGGKATRLAGASDEDMHPERLQPRGHWGAGAVLSSMSQVGNVGLAPGGTTRFPVWFVRHRLDGTVLDTVARFPGRTVAVVRSGGGTSNRFVPFVSGPTATGATGGIAVTGGDVYEVHLIDAAGSLSHVARLAEPPPSLSDEHLDALIANWPGMNADPDPAAVRGMRAMLEGFPLPATIPAYTNLVFADTGELWAQRYHLPGASMLRWDVFHPDGRYLGRVDVAASFEIHAVSKGQLLGVHEDELGVQRVQVRELRRGGADLEVSAPPRAISVPPRGPRRSRRVR